ncbi:MAG TPA: asparagine synthase (glutamine-hydrolyzing), partial [Anaerolineales bacterium]|nr:asparagine synthase (glutamine-hydrolyzing) [Anaerolineales bacterium]
MCGITGIVKHNPGSLVDEALLRQMLGMLRHRGPDQFGIYVDEQAGLGSARLSIIDLSSGQQPISNEDETLWIVFNGEIFNYIELRPELEKRGHHFATHSDTEVILHLYEDYGPQCLSYLNGQFAFAIWDSRQQSLFLARDRVGIRPIFYTETGSALVFGSEIKAILAYPGVQAELDPAALDDTFSYWSPQSPRSAFKGIYEVPPGSYMLVQNGQTRIERYWQLEYPDTSRDEYAASLKRPEEDYLAEFQKLLIDATQIRLRADVPVGAYLSGGLDSSTITAIIRQFTGNRLDTFSISFSDPEFDESDFQRRMAQHLGTDHQVVYATHADIGRIFPDVIWHTETPVTRTSPAPMHLLSRLVRQHNFKVVLTGEGADEFLGGYDIFKEAKIRRFWAREPESEGRQLLLQKLHPHIKDLTREGGAYLAAFFKDGLTGVDRPTYSHDIRWKTTRRTKRFFSPGLVEQIRQRTPFNLELPDGFSRWDPLAKAQYIEITTFMSPYLLSSQGDRPGMANS